MRIDSIMPAVVSRVSGNRQEYKQNIKAGNVLERDTVNIRPNFSMITFTGEQKNMTQVLSLAYENMGLGLPEDYAGGMGVVTYEAPKSFIRHEGLDVRSVSPFHNHGNHKGGFKFLYTKNLVRDENGKLPEQIEAKWFLSAEPGVDLEAFAKQQNFDPKDLRYVIQSEPNGKDADSKSKYCLIEPTGVKGDFERMSNDKVGELQKVNYELFQISQDNPSYNKIQNTPNYFMYTQELAKTPKPYTYSAGGHGGIEAEVLNSDFCRAVMKATEQMNTDKFGKWNPANIWGHDRVVAAFTNHMASESAGGNDYWNGIRFHYTAHNPGRYYQGFTDNPFEFSRIVFDKTDVNALKKHPLYQLVEDLNSRGWSSLKSGEKDTVKAILDPMIGRFKDFFGMYNITKIAIEATKSNPNNFTFGTVSPNFDKEMKSPDMDVAPGLGQDLREIKTISPLNGSTPASLGLDNNTADFGRGGNILSERKHGYTPLVYDGDIEKYLHDKELNAKWFTDILSEAQEKGQDTLNKVFFNDLQIEQGRSVMGNISDFHPGKDLLIIGWGRPDEQKAFPITLEGYIKFLENPKIPLEHKKAVKLQLGWGDAAFDKGSREWSLIKAAFDKIQTIEDGLFKNNCQLVDGRYPNKIVGCATHGVFTSRREMCGITPLESKAAATPYLATATGGPVDYTNQTNGWLTKTAPEMNPSYYGLTWGDTTEHIDDVRRARSSEEVADCFKAMAKEYITDRASYVARCKKNIEEKFDWHNNDEFNGGKSANKMYRNDVWMIDEGWVARAKEPLKKLVGNVQTANVYTKEAAEKALKVIVTKAEDSISKAADDAVKNLGNKVAEVTQQAVDQIKEAAVVAAKNANGSKVSKIAAFGGGLVAGIVGGGAWHLIKGTAGVASASSTTAPAAVQTVSPIAPSYTLNSSYTMPMKNIIGNQNLTLTSPPSKMAG
ncbi:hypothetical protein IKU74_04575 [bacterium]|nr:hypothetical protein [bacterium]